MARWLEHPAVGVTWCPRCRSAQGVPCKGPGGAFTKIHTARVRCARKVQAAEVKAGLSKKPASSRWTRDDAVTRGCLQLADADVPLYVIRKWNVKQVKEAEEWAGALHLRASDNNIRVPVIPRHVIEGARHMPPAAGSKVAEQQDEKRIKVQALQRVRFLYGKGSQQFYECWLERGFLHVYSPGGTLAVFPTVSNVVEIKNLERHP